MTKKVFKFKEVLRPKRTCERAKAWLNSMINNVKIDYYLNLIRFKLPPLVLWKGRCSSFWSDVQSEWIWRRDAFLTQILWKCLYGDSKRAQKVCRDGALSTANAWWKRRELWPLSWNWLCFAEWRYCDRSSESCSRWRSILLSACVQRTYTAKSHWRSSWDRTSRCSGRVIGRRAGSTRLWIGGCAHTARLTRRPLRVAHRFLRYLRGPILQSFKRMKNRVVELIC